jgi:1,2-diacylglycerol 3-alpha-glucosyltransferase
MSRVALPQHLNICLVARAFTVWGALSTHNFLWIIAKGLASQGHTVTILAAENPLGKPQVEQDGVKIYFLNEGRRVHRSDSFMNLVRAKFTELHELTPFHLLHSVDAVTRRISRSKKDYRLACVYDIEAIQMSQLFAILGMEQPTLGSVLTTSIAIAYKFLRTYYGGDRRLLKTADAVFVSSPQQRIALERYYLYPDARIYSVPYGIEIGDLAPREKSQELRVQLTVPESAKVVVTQSDMTNVDDIQNLLWAFERVVIKKPSSRLIILGTGPKFKDLEFAVLNLAMGGKVIFAGAVKSQDLPDYIALSDVFVNLSSRTTGFEPSLLEAMAQKKVIIGSEISPMASIVEHGKDGFLIRPADRNELSSLLLDIFTDQVPTTQIGESARRKVTDLFDAEKMVTETVKAYYAILKTTGYYKKEPR